jgi:hypothetical protein
MYLEAKRYVAPYDAQTEPIRRAIGAAIGYAPAKAKPGHDASLLEVCGVTVRVGYWRKFGALHRWFVEHVQGGHDDCRPAYVHDECLRDLQRVCERVIKDPARVSAKHNVEDAFDLNAEELAYTQEILAHAITLQQQGWDIYYRASW